VERDGPSGVQPSAQGGVGTAAVKELLCGEGGVLPGRQVGDIRFQKGAPGFLVTDIAEGWTNPSPKC
jgi:hypothetical protein